MLIPQGGVKGASHVEHENENENETVNEMNAVLRASYVERINERHVD